MAGKAKDGGRFPLLAREGSFSSSSQILRRRSWQSLLGAAKRCMPILEWLPAYEWMENSAMDIGGGATLGCILVAQSLAHADLCKVHLINGPYSCMLPPLVYSLFGTCIHSSVGTGGLISLLTGEQLAAYGDLEQRTHAGAIFTLLVGGMIALMGIFRLSFLVRFLSRPALSGFITASAILIIVSQFQPMLGLPKGAASGIQDVLLRKPALLASTNLPTLVLSITAYVFLASAKKLKRVHRSLKYIGDFKELFLLACSSVFCYKEGARLGIQVVGRVPSGLPSISWPLQCPGDMDLVREMLPGAFLVALVTFLSSFAGAKKFAMQAGYQVVATNELLALGFANAAGALTGAVPTQIGLSRMGIAYAAGVRSQLGANIYVAGIVAAVVQLFSSYLFFVPHCVLNAIIVNGASHLLEWEQMRWLWSLCRGERAHVRMFRVDFMVWWVACICTLYLGAFAGILVAVAVSLVLIVYQVANPPIIPLGWVERRQRWLNLCAHADARERSGLAVFRVEGPLFYANIEALQEWIAELEVTRNAAGQPLRAIVMSCNAMPFVDTTAIQALRQVMESCQQRNVTFLISNASGQPARIFRKVLADLMPDDGAWDSSFTVQECVDYMESLPPLPSVQEDTPAAKEDLLPPTSRSHSQRSLTGDVLSPLVGGDLIPLVRMHEVYSEMSLTSVDDGVKVVMRSRASSKEASLSTYNSPLPP